MTRPRERERAGSWAHVLRREVMRPAATLVILTAAASLSLLLGAASASRPTPFSPMGGGGGGGGMAAAGEEEKVRLGSSPPSCRNKCYQCSPCAAVQVPSLSAPSGPAAAVVARGTARADADDAARGDVRRPLVPLSNYKPLWWKCQCRDRLYDP